MHQMTLLYTETESQDAIDTFEDVQTELGMWKIPYTKGRGLTLKTTFCILSFINVDRSSIPAFQYKLFVPQKFKEMTDWNVDEFFETELCYYTRPFQGLVDIVCEIQKLSTKK